LTASGIPDPGSASSPVTVLAVASPLGLADLRRIFGHSRWTLLESDTLAAAMCQLRVLQSVVLVCEATLPDGSWKALVDHCRQLPVSPPVIVAADHADDFLWMEVLNRGAYNLLGKPFVEQEVFRVVSAAWLHLRISVREPLRATAK
jgi:FixJ family two-component response regulator